MARAQVRETGGQRGQEMVEFALTLPIIIALILGLVYASIILYSQVTLTNAARAGANFVVRNPAATDDQVMAELRHSLGVLNPTRLTMTVTPPLADRVPNVQVDVALSYSVPLPTIRLPSLGQTAGTRMGALLLVASSTMNLE